MKSALWIPALIVQLFCFLVAGSQAPAPGWLWAKRIGGQYGDYCLSITNDRAGNVYSTGLFSTLVDFNPGPGAAYLNATPSPDVYVCKLDSNGNYVWAKQLGGPFNDYVYGVTVDPFGNVFTIGVYQNNGDFDPGPGTATLTANGFRDVFISKLNVSGNYTWARTLGGINEDWGYAITTDARGNVYSGGNYWQSGDFDPDTAAVQTLTATGGSDAFISKLDSSGAYIWAKSVGGPGNDNVQAICLDHSGNVFTTGQYSGPADFDPDSNGTFTLPANGTTFILKLDSTGHFMWAKSLDGAGASSMVLTPSTDGIYVTGNFGFGTVDFDPGPGTFYLSSPASMDNYILKLDTNGNFLWAISFGGPGEEHSNSIQADANGNIYITGSFQGTADFDPDTGSFLMTAIYKDAFIAKFDSTGHFIWALHTIGSGDDEGYACSVNRNGRVFVGGNFTSPTLYVNPATLVNFNSSGTSDFFIAKLDTILLTGMHGLEPAQMAVQIYPNPADNNLTVKRCTSAAIAPGKLDFEICNSYGRTVRVVFSEPTATETTLTIEDLPPGMYYIKIWSGEKMLAVKKFVKL